MKARLPLGKKAKDEDEEFEEHEDDSDSSRNDDATDATDLSALEEEDAEEEEAISIVDKIKKKIKSLQKKSSKDDEDEESEASDEEDDEEAKKKKRSKIIQMTIGVALVIFLLSDYIFPPEEPVSSEGTEEIIPEPKADKPQTTETTPEPITETPTEVVEEKPVEATPETPVDPSVATETTPDSPVDVTSTVSPDQTTEPETTPPVTDSDTDPTEAQPDLSLGSTDTVSDIPIEDSPGESGEDIVGEDMNQGTDENLTDQILLDLEKQAKGTTKAEPKKEYVAPPDYEYRGRGLVYNCTGKHWACVDAPSYKTCEDNASSVSYLKKKVECHPFNVYETTKGCESMQNRMVSSSARTSFCNE